MKKLSKNIPVLSMIMMVAGLVLYVLMNSFYGIYVFMAGGTVLGIVRIIDMVKVRKGKEITRLPQIRLLSVVSLLVAGYLMFDGSNSWSVLLLVSAILEIYVTFRQRD